MGLAPGQEHQSSCTMHGVNVLLNSILSILKWTRAAGIFLLAPVVALLLAGAPLALAQMDLQPPEGDQPTSGLETLIETELSFARASLARGTRQAFLEYLADDAIVFRPEPVQARQWYMEHPATSGVLAWRPTVADVALAGDLGYTSGPWEYSANDSGGMVVPVAFGHYVSVWRRKAGDVWRLVLDLGVSHDRPDRAAAEAELTTGTVRGTGDALRIPGEHSPGAASTAPVSGSTLTDGALLAGRRAEEASLLAADSTFSSMSTTVGALPAYLGNSVDSVRYYRTGLLPVVGRRALELAMVEREGSFSWVPEAGAVSIQGDLGWTYGDARLTSSLKSEVPTDSAAAESSRYVRIWRKSAAGAWQVAVDVAIPAGKP